MKKIFGLLSCFACALLLATSCSSSSDESKVTLTVETELGDLGKYLTVTDKEVTVTLSEEKKKDDETKEETVYKVLTSSLALNVTKAVASDYNFDLEVEVLDENHVKIEELPNFNVESKMVSENGDLDNVLSIGNIRAQMKRGQEASKWDDKAQEIWDKICKEGKYIVIKPNWDNAKYAEYVEGNTEDVSTEDTSSEDVASDGNFDEWLDSYEEFCNDYISLIKKAAQGDMDAVSEYPEMLKKAQDLGEKMQQSQSEATPEQWARFLEIQKKLMKAAAE